MNDTLLWKRDGRLHYRIDLRSSPHLAFLTKALLTDKEGWPVLPFEQGWEQAGLPAVRQLLADLAANSGSQDPKYDWARLLVPSGADPVETNLIKPLRTRPLHFPPRIHVVCGEDGTPRATASLLWRDMLQRLGAPLFVQESGPWLSGLSVDPGKPETEKVSEEETLALVIEAVHGVAFDAEMMGYEHLLAFRSLQPDDGSRRSYRGLNLEEVWVGPYCADVRQLDGSPKPQCQVFSVAVADLLSLLP